MHVLHKFFKSVKNLIYWFPIIWKDRDYDYEYLLFILSHKLKSMEELHRYHGNGTGSENIANEILETRVLVDKISHCDYRSELFSSNTKMLNLYDNLDFKSVSKIEDSNSYKEFVNRLFEEDDFIEKDLDLLCDKLKNLREWWD